MDPEVVGRARQRLRAFALALTLTLAGLVVPSSARAAEGDLRERLEHELASHRVASASVAVVDRAGVRLVAGFGVADEANGRSADATTRFRVASISKLVIALALLRLRAEGRVRLEDEVRTLVPEASVVGHNRWQSESPLRLVHLMENTSGWDDFSPVEAAASGATLSLESALGLRSGPRDCRWRPGTRYSYSNEGAAVAARVVEKVSGCSFEAFAQDDVFLPLGMGGATYFNPEPPNERMATLHDGRGRALPDRVPLFRAAAGLAISARDMIPLLELFLSKGIARGGRYLPEADFDRMEHPESSRAGRGLPTAYGLFNQGLVDGSHVWRGHRGGIDGASADFFYVREAHVGYFLALSTDDDRAFEAVGKILRQSLLPEREPPRAQSVEPSRPDLSGMYVRENPRFEWKRARSELLELVYVTDEGTEIALHAPFLPKAAGRYRRAGSTTLGDWLFAREGQSIPELVAMTDGDDEPRAPRLVSGELSVRRVSWARALGTLVFFALVAAAFVSIPVDALRALLAHRRRAATRSVTANELDEPVRASLERLRHLGALSALGCVAVLVVIRERVPAGALGTPAVLSVRAFVASGLLPALVLTVGLVHVTERPRTRRWVSVAHTSVLLALVLALAWFGWLGARLWH